MSLADERTRSAVKEDLNASLFVEAGAGSGKTKALVDRVKALVLVEGVPLSHIAAVTFTEKAGAELRDRLRGAFEQAGREQATSAAAAEHTRQRADQALDDLDSAAIGTLHAFAQRILTEHPIEAELPPLVEVADEVSSQVAFEARWTGMRADLLGDTEMTPTLLLGVAAGVKPEQLRRLAVLFNSEWDRMTDAVLSPDEPLIPHIDRAPLLARGRALVAERDRCIDPTDRFLGNLGVLSDWVTRLEQAVDQPAILDVLGEAETLPWSYGRARNWPSCQLDELRERGNELVDEARDALDSVLDPVLRRLARRIAASTLEAAQQRRREGRLEFHDLLVLARELLRSPQHGREIRRLLHERYQRILLDEFQDTDPIQIELAVRIAGGASADATEWQDVDVPGGSLFVVGDPKQSIYRFRRADIGTYLQAREHVGARHSLTTNFRSTRALLEWVNDVFGRLITHEPGSSPEYEALHPDRGNAPGGTRVRTTGNEAHPRGTRADAVRELEARDVAAAIHTALAEQWKVCVPVGSGGGAREHEWRPVGLADIAILLPARTSLPQLEAALDAAGIPYRAEASSLVYRTPEVRDLLMAASAVDDASNALALVATLRSPLFGCGDDDLWEWKRSGGTFHLLAPDHDGVPDDHPVAEGIGYLQRLHRQRGWLTPSELLDRLVRDRRMLEVGADSLRFADVWRRLRFVVDQARAWGEAEPAGLRSYLDWAYRQGDESARVAEAVLPETDIDAVRITTVHAAKGREFPVVVLSGMSSLPTGHRSSVEVLWQPNGYALKLGKKVQTPDFEDAKPLDEQMGHYERQRLLYVACTRARDHLVVSLHRVERTLNEDRKKTNAELLAEAAQAAPHAVPLPPATTDWQQGRLPFGPALSPPPPYQDWRAGVHRSRASADRRSTVSASGLEGTDLALAVAQGNDRGPDAGLAKGARDLELPPWSKGRYGTAIGRAVHGVLQVVDLGSGAGLEEAVAAQCLAEGVLEYDDVVTALCRAALTSRVVQQAATSEHWREMYVGTTLTRVEVADTEGSKSTDDTVLEGFIDLVIRQQDGLVLVDYKTDAVPAPALDARVAVYTPQLAAYSHALEAATGLPVREAVLLFLSPAGATERVLSGEVLRGADLTETVALLDRSMSGAG